MAFGSRKVNPEDERDAADGDGFEMQEEQPEEKTKQEKLQDQLKIDRQASVNAEEKKMIKAMKFKALLAKWVPILAVGPYAWLLTCVFNIFWGPIASEALFFCSDLTTCYDQLETTVSSGVMGNVCNLPRDFVRYHTWIGFVYVLWMMALFLSPAVGCSCCMVRSINTLVFWNLVFFVLFGVGFLIGLVAFNDAALCGGFEGGSRTTIYWTFIIFMVQLALLFACLFFYLAIMLWNLRVEKERKKRVIAMMTSKTTGGFGFAQMSKMKADDQAEDDEEQAAKDEEQAAIDREEKARVDAMNVAASELRNEQAEVDAEAAAKQSEADERRRQFFGDEDEEGEEKVF